MKIFDNNILILRKRVTVIERLSKISEEQNIPSIIWDQYVVGRSMATGESDQRGTGKIIVKDIVEGVGAGCSRKNMETRLGTHQKSYLFKIKQETHHKHLAVVPLVSAV